MALKEDKRFQETIYIDSLTGLYNRFFLYKFLPEIIQRAGNSNSNFGVLMVDLDNFKNVNDTHGHLRGDFVLKEVAKVLNSCIRGEDVAIRYAGDEFIILFIGRSGESISIDSFVAAAKRIVEKCAKSLFKTEGLELSVTISAGLAIYPKDAKTVEDLIDVADKALYLSKDKGKNTLSLAKEVAQQITTKKEVSKLFPCAKFINRLPQMQTLKKILQDAQANKTFFVLVKGKSGIGKSRFLDEFKNFVDSQQIFSLKANASAKHTLQPYYVFCQALEALLENNNILSAALSASLSGEEIVALSGLIPLFKNFIKDSSQKISQEQGHLLFKAFRNICVDLSSSRGLLLYFDSIQLLDKATFELLNYLLNYEFVRKILICGAFNEEELKPESPCIEFLSSPKEKENLIQMQISALSQDEVKELIISIFPTINIPAEFYQYVYEITEGSPLFIEEMLKYLVESGVIFFKDNRWQLLRFNKEDIPSSLEEVLQRRFRKLDPETKEMLAKAVVIGEDFESEVLREIVKKDQGYLFELLDRAKKKSFVSQKEKIDNFKFIPSYLQKSMYEQMHPPERAQLHQEVIRSILEIYKDESAGALGDLVYHSEKAGDAPKFKEYKDKILKESQGLFDPLELSSYFEALEKEDAGIDIPSDVRIKKVEGGISDEAIEKLPDLIRFIFAAVKNIGLYPASNKIRESSSEKVYDSLKEILKGLSSITFNEVEKILLINNKRLKYQQEKAMVIEDFISLMSDRDIKGIQILSSIEKDELNSFLEVLSQNPQELRGGIIAQLMSEKGIKNIKLEAAFYKRIATQERFRPITEKMNKIMLMDFLSGKAKPQGKDLDNLINSIKQEPQNLARNLTEMAKSFLPQGREGGGNLKEEARIISEGIQKISAELLSQKGTDSQKDLNKLISSLDDSIKPYLFIQQDDSLYKDVVKSLSNQEIVDIIMAARRLPEKENVLSMRELYNKFISSSQGSENLKVLLKEKLKDEGLSGAEISFVMQKEYNSLSLQERIDTIIKLPPLAYSSVGENNIQDLIKELVDNSDTDDLQVLIQHFLSQLESKDIREKEVILKLLGTFFLLAPCESSEFDSLIIEVISGLIRELSTIDISILPSFLKDLEIAIQWGYKGVFTPLGKEHWIIRNRFAEIDKIISFLYEILDAKEESPGIQNKKIRVRDFIDNLRDSPFIDALVLELRDPFLDYNTLLRKQIIRFGRGCLKRLLSKILESRDFSWEGYLYRKKIAGLLQDMGKEGKEEFKNHLAKEESPQKLRQLIEIAGFLQSEDLLPVLEQFAGSKDYEIKEATIFALANIHNPEAKQILLNLAKDKDARIARLAKRQTKG